MPTLARRVLVSIAVVVFYRLLAVIPLPFLASHAPDALSRLGYGRDLGLLGLFRGGPLTAGSVVALGLTPLVSATLLVQLLAQVVPALRMKEHPDPDRAMARLTRMLCIPIALLEGAHTIFALKNTGTSAGPLLALSATRVVVLLAVLVAGTLVLDFIAGIASRHGIGNGVTLLLAAAALAADAHALHAVWANAGVLKAVIFLVPLLGCVLFAVYATLGRYELGVFTARADDPAARVTRLPFRMSGSGAAPLIVASSFIGVVRILIGLLSEDLKPFLYGPGGFVVLMLPLVVMSAYAFTRASTPAEEIADDLVQFGRFIPGVDPGRPTAKVVARLQAKVSRSASLMLIPFVVLPAVMPTLTGVPLAPLTGTGVLIAVSYFSDVFDQGARLRRLGSLDATVALADPRTAR